MTRANMTVGRALIVAIICVLLIQGARAWGSAADRNRRAHEIAAREPDLYRQLADKDGVLESQRRMYMERVRKLEAQVRDREQDLLALRARLAAPKDP
jgi:uncharacterized protein YceH (UPF0502 family)